MLSEDSCLTAYAKAGLNLRWAHISECVSDGAPQLSACIGKTLGVCFLTVYMCIDLFITYIGTP